MCHNNRNFLKQRNGPIKQECIPQDACCPLVDHIPYYPGGSLKMQTPLDADPLDANPLVM